MSTDTDTTAAMASLMASLTKDIEVASAMPSGVEGVAWIARFGPLGLKEQRRVRFVAPLAMWAADPAIALRVDGTIEIQGSSYGCALEVAMAEAARALVGEDPRALRLEIDATPILAALAARRSAVAAAEEAARQAASEEHRAAADADRARARVQRDLNDAKRDADYAGIIARDPSSFVDDASGDVDGAAIAAAESRWTFEQKIELRRLHHEASEIGERRRFAVRRNALALVSEGSELTRYDAGVLSDEDWTAAIRRGRLAIGPTTTFPLDPYKRLCATDVACSCCAEGASAVYESGVDDGSVSRREPLSDLQWRKLEAIRAHYQDRPGVAVDVVWHSVVCDRSPCREDPVLRLSVRASIVVAGERVARSFAL